MERNAVIEECALHLDNAAENEMAYANKYPDADGDRAELRSNTYRQAAESIRRLKQ